MKIMLHFDVTDWEKFRHVMDSILAKAIYYRAIDFVGHDRCIPGLTAAASPSASLDVFRILSVCASELFEPDASDGALSPHTANTEPSLPRP
jgi:hypothetical protein